MKSHKYQRVKDKYFSNATSKLYFKNSCKKPKASESSACEWNMEEETRKLVEKDFRPNTYFFIGICSLTLIRGALIGQMPIKNLKIFCQ